MYINTERMLMTVTSRSMTLTFVLVGATPPSAPGSYIVIGMNLIFSSYWFQSYIKSQGLDRLFPRAYTYLSDPHNFSISLDKNDTDSEYYC